jgi:hypothetical protein
LIKEGKIKHAGFSINWKFQTKGLWFYGWCLINHRAHKKPLYNYSEAKTLWCHQRPRACWS